MATPTLDLLVFDTHNATTLAIGDASTYPTGFSVSTPTIEITVPSYPMISLAFVAGSVQVYNSTTLGITTDNCENIALPDGLYKIKYSVYPAYLYYMEKTFLRVDRLMQKFDDVYMKLDMFECDQALKYQEQQKLYDIEDYINGAVAASNKCANKAAVEYYTKANSLIDKWINNTCCLK